MAITQTITCNVCGKQKREVNHWWVAYESQGVGFMLSPWNENLARNDIVQSLCGQECVIKAVSEWMQKPCTNGSHARTVRPRQSKTAKGDVP